MLYDKELRVPNQQVRMNISLPTHVSPLDVNLQLFKMDSITMESLAQASYA